MRSDVGSERRGGCYRSPLRKERAADTRRRIGTAALGLFTEHGFGGTTVAAIAERAGASAQTVYATFDSKGEILRALLTQMEENADAAGWRERIATEPGPRGKLTAFAQWSAGLFASSKAVIAAARGAPSDPALLELRAGADGHRRAARGVSPVAGLLAGARGLFPGNTDEAVEPLGSCLGWITRANICSPCRAPVRAGNHGDSRSKEICSSAC